MGAGEASLLGFVEASVKYHSVLVAALTRDPERVCGQGQAGSLTGAVASQRVTEASNGSLRVDGHHPQRV